MSAVMRLKAELTGYDPDDILCAVESETDALDLVDRLTEAVLADKALVDKAKERIDRIEARAERNRATLAAMMEEIQDKLERPLATLSLVNTARTLILTDTEQVPDVFWHPVVDKARVTEALKAGQDVPGAALSNQRRTLRIASK